MCIQDMMLLRHVKTRVHSGTATGAGVVLNLQADKARFGIIVCGTSAGTLQFTDQQAGSINETITKNSTSLSETQYLTFLQVGAFIWRDFQFRMTAAGGWTLIELYLPTDMESMLRMIKDSP